MTIRELIDELCELAEAYGNEQEVKVAHQPHWPLAHYLKGVVASRDLVNYDDDDYPTSDDTEMEETLWLVAEEGNCTPCPYAPKQLWEMI